jgi:hypothetical protein
VIFVLALGPGDLNVDLWRVADVLLGGVVGLLAVFAFPPRPRLAGARAQLSAYVAELVSLLHAMADESGTHATPLRDDTRHAFVGTSRALRDRAASVRDAVEHALESARFNVRARKVGEELDAIEREHRWLSRITIQSRALAGGVDRLYDRPGPAPALPRAVLAEMLDGLAALLENVAEHGPDGDARTASARLEEGLLVAVEVTTQNREVVDVLGSLTLLGRLEQLRETVAGGPRPLDAVEPSPEDAGDVDETSSASAAERLRRILLLR